MSSFKHFLSKLNWYIRIQWILIFISLVVFILGSLNLVPFFLYWIPAFFSIISGIIGFRKGNKQCKKEVQD